MDWTIEHARLDSIEFFASYKDRAFKLISRPLSGGHMLIEVIGDRLSVLLHQPSPSVLLEEDEYHQAFDALCEYAEGLCTESHLSLS